MRGTRSSSGSSRSSAPSPGSTGCRRRTATTSGRPSGCGWSSTSATSASRPPCPGWIRTTARNECLRLLAARGRTRAVDPQGGGLDTVTDDVADVDLVAAERRQALREALAELPEARRELLLLLLVDPPLAYEEISRRLGIPIGSIGPTRARAFAALRDTAALQRLALEPEGRSVMTSPDDFD